MSEKTPFTDPLFDDPPALDLPELTDSPPKIKTTEISDGEKFVVFFLDDELFAVAASQVAEIVRPLPLTPLPQSPAWLYGIANLRGAVISVLNLSHLCRKRTAADSSKSKLIVLKATTFAAAAAFPVDRLSEIVTLDAADFQTVDDARLVGRAVYKNFSVAVLDTQKLFSSLSIN